MTGQELADKLSKEIAETGYKQEVYAIGPAGIPISIQALLPPGFKAFINLVLIKNDQPNSVSDIHQIERSAGNGSDPERHQAVPDQSQ